METGEAQSDRLFSQPDISSKLSQLNVSKHVARALPFSLLVRNDIYLQICAPDPCTHSHELMYRHGISRNVAFFPMYAHICAHNYILLVSFTIKLAKKNLNNK